MKQYLDLVKTVLDEGTLTHNRTGTDTLAYFGYHYKIDLSDGFPLLTTKKIFFFKLNLVKPMPVPLTRILYLIIFGILKSSTIFKPSLIIFAPPVNITILGLSMLLYFVKDKIFFLKLFNSIKKRVNIEVNKNIKKILKILDNIKIQFKLI